MVESNRRRLQWRPDNMRDDQTPPISEIAVQRFTKFVWSIVSGILAAQKRERLDCRTANGGMVLSITCANARISKGLRCTNGMTQTSPIGKATAAGTRHRSPNTPFIPYRKSSSIARRCPRRIACHRYFLAKSGRFLDMPDPVLKSCARIAYCREEAILHRFRHPLCCFMIAAFCELAPRDDVLREFVSALGCSAAATLTSAASMSQGGRPRKKR